MDEQDTKRIKDAIASAHQNFEQAVANVNYWKGQEDALTALLNPPATHEPNKTKPQEPSK